MLQVMLQKALIFLHFLCFALYSFVSHGAVFINGRNLSFSGGGGGNQILHNLIIFRTRFQLNLFAFFIFHNINFENSHRLGLLDLTPTKTATSKSNV